MPGLARRSEIAGLQIRFVQIFFRSESHFLRAQWSGEARRAKADQESKGQESWISTRAAGIDIMPVLDRHWTKLKALGLGRQGVVLPRRADTA